jgi:FAD/FMN-containing dehydrogenase
MQRVRRGLELFGLLIGSALTALGTVGEFALKRVGLHQPLLAIVALTASACHTVKTVVRGVLLNDVHSRLNATTVASVTSPRSTSDLVALVRTAKREGQSISMSGGRHAMGGQQFGTATMHLSLSQMNDVLAFDREGGIIRVEAGIEWPKLLEYLRTQQPGPGPVWGITQKQTGADRLSVGGALAANAHGRGLRFRPLIQDVEAFTLVNGDGEVLTVSRTEHPELFRLAIGGYGLFGVIATVDLRLTPRQKLRRVVDVVSIDDLPKKVKERLDAEALYGDFQYKTDIAAPDFMQVGVLSTYHPVPLDTPIPEGQKRLSPDDWDELLMLAHTRKSEAFERYSRYYLHTNGQVYWSDTHQMGYYNDAYEDYLRRTIPDYTPGSLMITEVYVPRERLREFTDRIIAEARAHAFDVIYGTMRLIEQDEESFLVWAREDYACIIFNLRVRHTTEGIAKARDDFQRLIDSALEFGGSYFLTYHRWARKDQVLRAYPQFPEFLQRKLQYDPAERFQSDWYRHYKAMFAEELQQVAAVPIPHS